MVGTASSEIDFRVFCFQIQRIKKRHKFTWHQRFSVFRGPDHWANEFGAESLQQESVDDQWVNEFSKLHVDDWAEEFDRQVGVGALGDSSSDNWANSYDEFLSGRTLQGVSMYFLI
ncbi:hypothetical protein ES332_A07G271000v1 [Gossypium tomentosum]|uniref:Peroxisome biogenesis protein 5-like n=1 Tax=Gossypium tomentosum TaxID=34277 RepID=A0A5D2PXF9_GOSTO|nr:hypothetical protein ES332_A07G271000v1 [Gossypium tomentosum]